MKRTGTLLQFTLLMTEDTPYRAMEIALDHLDQLTTGGDCYTYQIEEVAPENQYSCWRVVEFDDKTDDLNNDLKNLPAFPPINITKED